MNLNYREIRRMNIKSCFDLYFCRSCLNCFLNLSSKRLSAHSTIRLASYLVCVGALVCRLFFIAELRRPDKRSSIIIETGSHICIEIGTHATLFL